MLTSRKRLLQDRFQTFRYYKSPKFALIDLAFGCIALFSNPYRTCRKFLQRKQAQNIHAYGETPLATYQRIVEQCGITSQDTWMEMGAGRGKGCFWLAHFIQCKVIGIEWVPQFATIANVLKALFKMDKVSFHQIDMEKADLSKASVIYLYGTWPKLQISQGTKVITISEPLEGFTVLKTFWVRYPWGRTAAYLQTVPLNRRAAYTL